MRRIVLSSLAVTPWSYMTLMHAPSCKKNSRCEDAAHMHWQSGLQHKDTTLKSQSISYLGGGAEVYLLCVVFLSCLCILTQAASTCIIAVSFREAHMKELLRQGSISQGATLTTEVLLTGWRTVRR